MTKRFPVKGISILGFDADEKNIEVWITNNERGVTLTLADLEKHFAITVPC